MGSADRRQWIEIVFGGKRNHFVIYQVDDRHDKRKESLCREQAILKICRTEEQYPMAGRSHCGG